MTNEEESVLTISFGFISIDRLAKGINILNVKSNPAN